MRTVYTLGIAALALGVASTARANLLVNPVLASGIPVDPTANLLYVTNSLNDNALGGWSITKGTVDIVPNSYWQAPGGANFSVDLIGTPGVLGIGTPGPGTLEQTVEGTVAGTKYLLTWQFSINPEKPWLIDETGTTKRLQVTALGSEGSELNKAVLSGVAGTRTRSNMAWEQETLSFTADGPTTTIRFEALDPLNLPAGLTAATALTGPVIGDISLEPLSGTNNPPDGGTVPEPASLGVLGVGGLLLLKRRSQRGA